MNLAIKAAYSGDVPTARTLSAHAGLVSEHNMITYRMSRMGSIIHWIVAFPGVNMAAIHGPVSGTGAASWHPIILVN